MSLLGWGRYPKVKNIFFNLEGELSLKEIIVTSRSLIPYGNGRSYGDSALNERIVKTRPYNYFLEFDEPNGILHVQSGVLLSEILNFCIPKGWFLRITPGTKLITIGGAIASDVHGKNHHIDGCFSECIVEFRMMLPSGEVITCSKLKNYEIFKATCGGMGLTGVILDAKIRLVRIESQYVDQVTIKTKNLKQTFKAFEKYRSSTYSVAWIDCLARGEGVGRSLLMLGEFGNDGDLDYRANRGFKVFFNFPSFALHPLFVKIFNFFYYQRIRQRVSKQKVTIDSFFYPLDAIRDWNKIYGKEGFIQYQLIFPKSNSYNGLREVLNTISLSKKGSFLAVLKLHGPENENYLSFPMEGYSLALDFRMDKTLENLLAELDNIVLKYNGRIYLAKDSRVEKEIFEQNYPNIEKFRELRGKLKMNKTFNSAQSRRVGI